MKLETRRSFAKVRRDLVNFIEMKIFPVYETFDKGHDLNHITAVIDRALGLYEFLNDDKVDVNIVYAAAALHDIGISVERKNHAVHSQEFVVNSSELKEMFTDEEITIIGEAVADHSTSKGIEPRSIYGKIVCDADKDDNLKVSLMRAYEFTKKYYPDFSEDECLQNVYEQLLFKFGDKGKVIFWINSDRQEQFKNKMNELANSKELYLSTMRQILEEK